MKPVGTSLFIGCKIANIPVESSIKAFLPFYIIMMILLAVGKIFYSDFGLFYQVTQNSGAIYSTTNTIDTYVYRTLIQTGDVGMSAAAGVYQSVVGFLIVLITNLLLRKISPEDSLF